MAISLFDLPRELRNYVWFYSFAEKGGYIYEDTKLRTANYQHIDISLLLVSRAIYAEAKDLPLQANRITFTSTSINERRATAQATRFDRVYLERQDIRGWLVNRCRWCITDAVRAKIEQKYPSSHHLLEYLDSEPPSRHVVLNYPQDWYQTPSIHHECITYLLQQMSEHPNFRGLAFRALYEWHPGKATALWSHLKELVSSKLDAKPWDVPSEEDVRALEQTVGMRPCHTNIMKRSFSAASQCIKFLNSLPEYKRKSIRRVTLWDQHVGAGGASSHVLGLIPFALENPRLRIGNHVGLWYNVIAGSPKCTEFRHCTCNVKRLRCNRCRAAATGWLPRDYVPRWQVSEAVTVWIQEAKRAFEEGLPQGSFEMFFSCSDLDVARKPWKILLEDAAWQRALEICQERGQVPMEDPSQRFSGKPETKEHLVIECPRPCQFSADFPRDIDDILHGTSFVHIGTCPGPGHEDAFESVATMIATRDGRILPDVGAVIANNWHCRFPSDWGRKWWALAERADDSAIWDSWRDVIRDYRLYFSQLQTV
jgi:hypothetical protein